MFLLFFFFSSRRRHTRSLCDWSSDVCSSDLIGLGECSAEVFETQAVGSKRGGIRLNANGGTLAAADANQSDAGKLGDFLREGGVRQVFHLGKRSEERRVGKECRYRGATE